ncbi:MAG: hypothetical protein E7429_00360 [Ruminococcaceae bacterium]|nr:hypothetical protein [Oscillospiraceae bacterium]
MQVKKIVAIFYLMYTAYILIICGMTDITVLYILPALGALWLSYACFAGGARLSGRLQTQRIPISLPNYISLRPGEQALLWAAAIFGSMVCSVFVVHFYTGMWPAAVVRNLLTGVSNYYTYAYYFAEYVADLSAFAKLPYILMNAFIMAVFAFGVVYWGFRPRVTPGALLMALLCSAGYLCVSVGRGTNIELYLFVILVVYIILRRVKLALALDHFSARIIKTLLLCFCVGLALVAVYYVVLDARGYHPQVWITEDIMYDSSTLIARYLPTFALLILNLFGYLGFGLFYIASFMQEVWVASPVNFLAAFLPGGYSLLVGENTISIMERTIDVGVKWHADLINGVNTFGIFGLFLLIGLLGFVCEKQEALGGQWSHMLEFLILLQMLSFPVGNFVVVSSGTRILALLVIAASVVRRRPQTAAANAAAPAEGTEQNITQQMG